jgi:hypothetical protein
MENLRKKNETEIQKNIGGKKKEIQKKKKGHSSRLEQAEDRTSELKDEMAIKRKTEGLLGRQLKTCERNMQ